MMQDSSFLPTSGQFTVKEQHFAPPSSAFMLESRNDDITSDLEIESDPLSESLLPLPTEPTVSKWKRIQPKLNFFARAITLGIFLFLATALVANALAFLESILFGVGSHQQDARHSLTLTLSLDEDTASRISSTNHLAQILDIDLDESGVMTFVWPQQDSNDCPHCGQIDDDGPSTVYVSKTSESDDGYWTLHFNLLKNGDKDEKTSETHRQHETKNLRSGILYEENTDLPIETQGLPFSAASVNGALDDSEKLLVSEIEALICAKIMDVVPEDYRESVDRICQLLHQHSEESVLTANNNKDNIGTTLLGNDRDDHGCIASAGYSWCQSLNACHRPWMTTCEPSVVGLVVDDSLLGNDRDDHGCDRSAGFSWCKASNSCHRAWESGCGDEEQPLLGNDRDDYGCDRSAGYSWCNASNSCHRAWETTCGGTNEENDGA